MKKNKSAFSVIEAMVVLAILSIGMVGVYGFLIKSNSFLDGVSSKIEAIEIAREGIEALENIRNTNWLRFGANIDNCWDTLNYAKECVLGNSEKIGGKTYILKNKNGFWELEKPTGVTGNLEFINESYREKFSVGRDNGLRYCQPIKESTDPNERCSTKTQDGELVMGKYTRKIVVENVSTSAVSNKVAKLKVTVVVEWIDTSTNAIRKIELVNLMTNYKK